MNEDQAILAADVSSSLGSATAQYLATSRGGDNFSLGNKKAGHLTCLALMTSFIFLGHA